MTMIKPVRLEMNNSGAWKILKYFDAADTERTDVLMNSAAKFANVLNEGSSKPEIKLRVVTDESIPELLMRYDAASKAWQECERE